jgi:oxygen-dependent protoporphyrinogen oxidase
MQILRVSVGRDGDTRALQLADDKLVDGLNVELGEAIGVAGRPAAWRVSRWPSAFPQYDVGHLDRVDRIEQALASDVPELAVAGSSYRGSGIPACIASGRRAAAMVTSLV